MIVLTVLSYNGAPTESLSASFDELGGSIGRADNNQLVLPDPERTISRVHARVVFRSTGYTIVDNGSNPISVNGIPPGSGREFPLVAGDQVQIGGYLLAASAGAKAGAGEGTDLFADFFGDAVASPPPAARAPAPAAVAAPRQAAHTAWSAGTSAAASGVGQIPDDWDAFSDESASRPPVAAPVSGSTSAMGLPLNPVGGDSIDELFNLGAAPPGGDPLGAAPQQALLMQPNTAAHADPLQALSRPSSIAAASVADHASELNTPLQSSPLVHAPTSAAPLAPAGAVFSWEDSGHDRRATTRPGFRRSDSAPSAPPAAPVLAPAAPAQRAPAAGDDPLLAALLEGLATPGLQLDGLTPELMRLIGQLLHESTRGAVDLLGARAAVKREMRAEMTMIGSQKNNPLKFSPSAEVALQHLLRPFSRGFMPAVPAVRDAFDDLRAHQLGVMAGTRAALEGVLQRFDPKQLEAKLTHNSPLKSLIPAMRKARLWELFQELFSQLSREAQDDFEELFGKNFRQAYEAQLARLQAEPGPK